MVDKISNNLPWLEGLYNWYDDSAFNQWGRDLQKDVVNPLLLGAYRTATGDLTSGVNEAKGIAQVAAGIPDALIMGAETAAMAPYAIKRGGLEGGVNAIDAIWRDGGPAGNLVEKLPGDSSAVMQGASTLFRPIAEAPKAAGEAIFEATGSPAAATAGETGTAALEMIFPTKNVRNIIVPGTGKRLNLYGADPALPGPRPPINPMDPAGFQKGAVRVLDPDADTIRGMFEKPARTLSPIVSTNTKGGPQGTLFPETPMMKSVIPEAISRLSQKYGEKEIPAKTIADEFQRMGVKPEELDMFGLTGMLSYGVEEGHRIAPSDLRDAVAQNGNELQILTGGGPVSYGGGEPRESRISPTTENARQASRDFDEAARQFFDFDDQRARTFVQLIRGIPALRTSDTSKSEFMENADQIFEFHAKSVMGEDYRERLSNSQDGRAVEDWDKRKEKFLKALDIDTYWRQKSAAEPADDSAPESDPSLYVAKNLESSPYQTQYKNPGSIDDTITLFNLPESAYGGRRTSPVHFNPPPGYASMAHKRGGLRLALPNDFPYDTLSDVPKGTDIPVMSFVEERQSDAHRMAQSDSPAYAYSRDLYPQEANRLLRLENEMTSAMADYKQAVADKDFEAAERAQELHTKAKEEVEKLKSIRRGSSADLPYKGRAAQTKLLLKDEMIKAVERNAEFVGMATRRMVAMAQGGGDNLRYVEDVRWNPDDEEWESTDDYGTVVPPIEMKRHFTDERLKAARESIPSRKKFMRDWLLSEVEMDPDIARRVIEDRDGIRLREGVGFKVPDYYFEGRKTRKTTETYLDRGPGRIFEAIDIPEVSRHIASLMPGEDADAVAAHIRTTAMDVIFGDRGPLSIDFVAELGGEYSDLDDYVTQEAVKFIRDDNPKDRSNTMLDYDIENYVDSDDLEELYQERMGFGETLTIGDEVIANKEVAGSAANYDEHITIDAIQQIYDELGLGKYEPTYVTTPITDSPTDDLGDWDNIERVPVFPVTNDIREAVLSGSLTLFGPLNTYKSPAEKRADSVRRRQEAGSGLFGQTGTDLHPTLVKSPRELGGGLFAPLPTNTLRGLPETVYVPGKGEVKYGNFQPAVDAAKRYMESAGLPYSPPSAYAPLIDARSRAYAKEYDRMKHDPNNPEVKRSYGALISETLAQYRAILETGLRVEFGGYDSYDSPRGVIDDVINNNHMFVHPTRDAFGVDTAFDASDNPLLAETEFTDIHGAPMLANDVFRVVHDYFGHIKNGVGFRARGEEAAYQSHAAMYSPPARRALASETRGQNSWVNFGPHGDKNRSASPDKTIYADQKTGLMPSWVAEEGRLSARDRRQRYRAARESGTTGFEGALTDDGRLEIVHYSHEPLSRTDPERWTEGLSRRVKSEVTRKLSGAPGRTFFGIEAKAESPYRKEQGLGDYRHVTTIDPELIYDAKANPDGLWEPARGNMDIIIQNEQRLKDVGYTGYFFNDPSQGKIIAIFDPLDVEPKPYE